MASKPINISGHARFEMRRRAVSNGLKLSGSSVVQNKFCHHAKAGKFTNRESAHAVACCFGESSKRFPLRIMLSRPTKPVRLRSIGNSHEGHLRQRDRHAFN